MAKNKCRLALMFGGQSGEHEISIRSAASVYAALDMSRYHIELWGCDKQGQWYHQQQVSDTIVRDKPLTLNADAFSKCDVVLPIMHGPLYEDGCLQGLLELYDVAYFGSGPLSSGIAMDKAVSKLVVQQFGVKTAPFVIIKHDDNERSRKELITQAKNDLAYPMFVKPACLGSSVGVSKVENETQLIKAITCAFRYDEKIILEKAISGREIELAVLTSKGKVKVSLPGEITMVKPGGFYSYEAKYLDKSSALLHAPASLSKDIVQKLQQAAETAFKALDCEGLARVDFFLEEGTNDVIFNEINTLPGFTEISMYPKLWSVSGLEYPELLDALIDEAKFRHERRRELLRDYM
jgi:D-alanine-D-alanine ligase